MKDILTLLTALQFAPSSTLHAAYIEISEKLELPECHSLGWVNAWVRADPKGLGKGWDGVLDEAKWGTPSPQQLVTRNWDWKITDDQWREAVKQKGEGKSEEVRFDLWIPEGVEVVKGIVVMSGHGSPACPLERQPNRRSAARRTMMLPPANW